MPIIWTLAENAVLLARVNDDNSNLRQSQEQDGNEPNNHRRLEIGVIVAIVVFGLAITGFVATCLVKRKRRAAKRAAKTGVHEVEEEWVGTAGKNDIEMHVDAGEEREVEKVSFVGGGEEEAPPTYQSAVTTGDSKIDRK